MRVAAALVLCLSLASAVGSSVAEPAPLRVLFIGNSLTAANDLPEMVAALAASTSPALAFSQQSLTVPGFSLEDHWHRGEARRLLKSERWTHVVLQQGPSSLMESQVLLREYAARFAGEARANGTAVVLYGVWPERARLRALDAVTASYARAAEDAKGALVAAGEGWRAAWARNPSLALYGPDDFHPSPLGGALNPVEPVTCSLCS